MIQPSGQEWKQGIPIAVVTLVRYVVAQNWQSRHVRFAEEYGLTPSWMSQVYNGKKLVASLDILEKLTTAIRQDAARLPDKSIAKRLRNVKDYADLQMAADELFPTKTKRGTDQVIISIRKSHLYLAVFMVGLLLLFSMVPSWLESDSVPSSTFLRLDTGVLIAPLDEFDHEVREANARPKSRARKHFVAALDEYESGHFLDAAKSYRMAIANLPALTAYLNYGSMLFKSGKQDSAALVWQNGLEVAEGQDLVATAQLRDALHRNIALCFEVSGDTFEALHHLRQSLLLNQANIANSDAAEKKSSYDPEIIQRVLENLMRLYMRTVTPDYSAKFADAPERVGILGAEPFDNGGGVGPHLWGTLWVQDFRNEARKQWYVAVYNNHTDKVVFLENDIRNFWLSNQGFEMGPPIGELAAQRDVYLSVNRSAKEGAPDFLTVWVFGDPKGRKKTIARDDRSGEFRIQPLGRVVLRGESGSKWYVRLPEKTELGYSDTYIATVEPNGWIAGWMDAGDYPSLVRKLPDGTVDTIIAKRVEEGSYEAAPSLMTLEN